MNTPKHSTTASNTATHTKLLTINNLTVTYNRSHEAPILNDVTLTPPPHQITALVGESGSGKSTLARAITGRIRPQNGQVHLGDENVLAARGSRGRLLRRRLQLVPQDPQASLDPRMTIGRSIAEGLPRMPTDQRKKRVAELLEEVALDPAFADSLPRTLSGGQRQRVALARALAAEPDILIADEVTSALDVSVQAGVLLLLQELRTRLGLTILFITHDLAVVSYIAHRVAVLHAGKIVEEGPTADVLSAPTHPYTRELIAAVPSGLSGKPRTE